MFFSILALFFSILLLVFFFGRYSLFKVSVFAFCSFEMRRFSGVLYLRFSGCYSCCSAGRVMHRSTRVCVVDTETRQEQVPDEEVRLVVQGCMDVFPAMLSFV